MSDKVLDTKPARHAPRPRLITSGGYHSVGFLGCGRSLVMPGGAAFPSLSVPTRRYYVLFLRRVCACVCVFAFNVYILIQFRVLITTSGRLAGHHSSHVYVGGCCIVTDKCSGSVIIRSSRLCTQVHLRRKRDTQSQSTRNALCIYV